MKELSKEIFEYNKGIALFMGYPDGEIQAEEWCGCNVLWECPFTGEKSMVPANYHESWGLLMPVIEKIEQHGCIVEIWLCLGKGCRIIKGSFKSPTITIANTESNCAVKAVWDAVVEFIEWHNQNPPLPTPVTNPNK